MQYMKPLAIVPLYNDGDIAPDIFEHLLWQGCAVHVVDNWSVDGGFEWCADLAKRNPDFTLERWPESGPLPIYDWTGILKRIEEIGMANQGRWIILHDADEIRRPPSADGSIDGDRTRTLAEMLRIVASHGYNAVHYRVVTFKPVDNGYTGDPEHYFQHYSLDGIDSLLPHIKAWIQGPERVDLHTHGGHQAMFSGRKVFPVPFVLKHYPIRTQEQGERKLFRDRLPRYPEAEKRLRWHEQYAGFHRGQNLICDPVALSRLE